MIRFDHIAPYDELAAAETQLDMTAIGAAAHFIGTMRNHHNGQTITSLELEHYPPSQML